ncbi:MAG TPA: hypothetical protein VGD90_06725 [Sphingobacteriaceae bacterium]
MKSLLLFIFLSVPALGFAQNWDEFFKQKETQKEYLLQQLVALKIYAGYLKEGYETIQGGLTNIRKFTNGELDLHSFFFSSLANVHPVIKNNPKALEVILSVTRIQKDFNGLNGLSLTAAHREYVMQVKAKITEESEKDLEELVLLMTSDVLKMDDEERLVRLDKIYESSMEKVRFTRFFVREVKEILLLKRKEGNDVQTLINIYKSPK